MNSMRNIAFMAMGSALTLAYQKYNKPMMKAVKKTFSKAASGAENLTDKLDNMMQKKGLLLIVSLYFSFF